MFNLSLFSHEEEVLVASVEAKLWKKYGQSAVFIASTQLEDEESVEEASLASLLKEAIHVISCGYEEKTEWGKEVKNSSALYNSLYILFGHRCGTSLSCFQHISSEAL